MDEREERDELGLPRSALDEWEPLEPDGGFAARVVERLERERGNAAEAGLERPKRPGGRRGLVAAAVAAAAAATLVLVFGPWAGRASSGAVRAEGREALAIGSRATAVAEAGAAFRWVVDGRGTARVEQSEGRVFYRVERAEDRPFVVATPAGEVRVRGTSFHVEVEPMGQVITRGRAAAAALGAAAAAAVVVTVYEGRVALANGHGETEVGPGEMARAEADAPPGRPVDLAETGGPARRPGALAGAGSGPAAPEDEAGLSAPALRERLAALRAEGAAQAEEIEALRGRIRALETTRGGGPSETERLRSSPWYPAAPEDLEALVGQCGLRNDVPPVMGLEPGSVGEDAERMGIAEGEIPVVDGAIRRLHDRFLAEIRGIYLEATGDEAGAETLSADAMIAQITAAALPGEVQEAHRQLARERAGQAEPPADLDDLPPAARALRLHAGLGDELQRLVAADLGPERSHELRAAAGGWPWGRSYSRACE